MERSRLNMTRRENPPPSSIDDYKLRFEVATDSPDELRDLLVEMALEGGQDEWELARQVRSRIDQLKEREADHEIELEGHESIGSEEPVTQSNCHPLTSLDEAVVASVRESMSRAIPYKVQDRLIHSVEDASALTGILQALEPRQGAEFERLRAQTRALLCDLGYAPIEPEDASLEDAEGNDQDLGQQALSSAGDHAAQQELCFPKGTTASTRITWTKQSAVGWRPLQLLNDVGRPRTASDLVHWGERTSDLLPPARSASEYDLHLAATEWAVDPAILIRSADDIQARKHWQELLEPYEHQVRNLITFCRRAPVGLIADDVGLGKTISAGLILSELMTRGKVQRALIMAPKLLLPQWQEELSSKFQIPSQYATGAELDGLLGGRADIVITTYDSARSRMDKICNADFDMLILDEAHKLRNLYPGKPPRIASTLRDVLQDRVFRYVLMLTATPIQNRLWDLYSLVDLLTAAKGHMNPLGTVDQFNRRFIADGKSKARVLQPGEEQAFRNILGQYMVRTSRANCGLEFPTRHVKLEQATPVGAELDLIRLVSELIDGLNALAQTSLAQALMSSPAALVKQLESMEKRRSVPPGVALRAKILADRVPRPGKLSRLLELVRGLRSEKPETWRILIFTCRKETQARIGKALEEEFGPGVVGFIQGGRASSNQRSIEGYTADPPRTNALVSTDAGAEGVNLQAGNVVVNYDLPWNPMVLEQRIGRVQRLGSDHANVVVLNLVVRGSIEERIVGRLADKLMTISTTLGDLEGVLESMNADGEGEASFETVIRKMVVDSLKGKDVERSIAKIQKNIDRAKILYEEEKGEVEEKLGNLDAMHSQGPTPPHLTPVVPRMSEREFATRGLKAEGGRITPVSEGLFRLKLPGQSERMITFGARTPIVAPKRVIGFGQTPQTYAAGKRPFEMLKGRWQARAGHHVLLAPQSISPVLEERALGVLSKFGHISIESITVTPKQRCFQGSVAFIASTSIEHDRYEKLIEVDMGPAGCPDLEFAESSIDWEVHDQGIAGDDFGPELDACCREAAAGDPDIDAFNGYYLSRLGFERKKADGRPELLELAARHYTPRMTTRVVGFQGRAYDMARAQVSFTLDEHGPYEVQIDCIPALGIWTEEPTVGTCSKTLRKVPLPCLATCELTGVTVLEYLLGTSDVSGRRILEDSLVTCQVSGSTLAPDECRTSFVSGMNADARLFGESAASGAPALKSELVECAFTKTFVLPSELRTSEISGKPYRVDQERHGGHEGVAGHESEFVQCAWGKDYCLPDETVRSDVSGMLLRRDRSVTSVAPPHRVGAPSEIVQCSVSEQFVLEDEVEVSSVSSRTALRRYMGKSAQSDRWALKEELVTCSVTGQTLVPDEVDQCSVTGRIAASHLLGESEESGGHALLTELRKCEETGTLALPSELEMCEVTRRMVLGRLLHNCAITGTRALERLMVQCAVTGDWLLEIEAVHSHSSDAPMKPDQAVTCQWDGKPRLPDETGICSKSGITVALEYLDKNDRLLILSEVADESSSAATLQPPASDLQDTPEFHINKLSHLSIAKSPTGTTIVVAGTTRGLLGLGKKRLAQLYTQADSWTPLGPTMKI